MIYEKTLHRKLKIEKHDIIFSHLQNVILLLYVNGGQIWKTRQKGYLIKFEFEPYLDIQHITIESHFVNERKLYRVFQSSVFCEVFFHRS
jgi:hypothetical protein